MNKLKLWTLAALVGYWFTLITMTSINYL